MSIIEKLTLENPTANIMIIKNACINNNIIYYNNNNKPNFLPTMYQSWTEPQREHISFIEDKSINDISSNNILYIFDTWGISSYYHLLIDHVIPLWITTKIIEEKLDMDINLQTKKSYYRVSNNNYTTSLSNSNDIFKLILNENWVDNINGNFKYIIYGYAFTYRSLRGPNDLTYYENYEKFINIFHNNFYYNLIKQEKYIIIAKRITRNNSIIDNIFTKINSLFNIKYIDFSEYSINEQQKLCASAYALIGMEGAAFSNQVFMPKKSCLICISPGDNNSYLFHSTLSKYLKNSFYNFSINKNTNDNIIDNIIKILYDHLLKYS